MQNGWIKLHRSIKEWEWYQDVNTTKLFLHLLIEANWEPKYWQGVLIDRGQVAVGRRKLALETGLSERAVRTSLKRLKTSHEVTLETSRHFSIITICNYERYQEQGDESVPQNVPRSDRLNDQQVTSLTTTTKEYKNKKKSKNKTNKEKIKELLENRTGVWLEPEMTEVLETWIEFREELKKPLTPTTVKTLLKKYQHNATRFVESVEFTTEKGWQGLRHPDQCGDGHSNGNKPTEDDKWEEMRKWAREYDEQNSPRLRS